MKFIQRRCHDEADYWRVRNFLREVFLANGRLENSWHVARLDHWRWHLIATCQITPPFAQVTAVWETDQGELAAVLHPYGDGEIRLHIHPRYRSPELEAEIFAYAVEQYAEETAHGRLLIVPVLADDTLRQETLSRLGLVRQAGWNHHYWRDLTDPLPGWPLPDGYYLRSMGDESEHPARSWCSWRAFHADEPDDHYDGDSSWYRTFQSAPLYRRDLDVVVIAPDGRVAAFCTCAYDDYTRSAVTVLVGVAAEHWRRGLGKAVVGEGMRRLKHLGCTRVFATAADEPADALYRSVMQNHRVTDTWVKQWPLD